GSAGYLQRRHGVRLPIAYRGLWASRARGHVLRRSGGGEQPFGAARSGRRRRAARGPDRRRGAGGGVAAAPDRPPPAQRNARTGAGPDRTLLLGTDGAPDSGSLSGDQQGASAAYGGAGAPK